MAVTQPVTALRLSGIGRVRGGIISEFRSEIGFILEIHFLISYKMVECIVTRGLV
jgi:hypothetical protein